MTGQGRNAGDTRWLLIATIAGIMVVVVMALLFFSGYIAPPEPTLVVPSAAKTVDSTLTPTITTVTTTQSGTRPVFIPVFTETTALPVSSEGVYLSVDYIGAFSGIYSVNGVEQTVRNSGTRVYPLPDATGTVSATFQKEDGTTKHALTIGIYKDGKLLRSDAVSAAHGKVSITVDI